MAKPTRRSLLRAGVVVAAMSVPLGATSRALSVVAGLSSPGLRRSTFRPHLGSAFTFAGEEGSFQAVLTEVGNVKTAPRDDDRKFRMLFKATGARPVGGTYRLSHRKIGSMALFVSPVGAAGDVYEAVVDAP